MTVMIVSPHREWLSILQMPAAGRGKVVQASQCNAVHLHWHGTCTCVSVWYSALARQGHFVWYFCYPSQSTTYQCSTKTRGYWEIHTWRPRDFPRTEFSKAMGMDFPFSHHYQGRIEFNTVNLFHSAGMDLACILASRVGLTNPLPRAKIDQSSPCRGLSTHPRAMNTQ